MNSNLNQSNQGLITPDPAEAGSRPLQNVCKLLCTFESIYLACAYTQLLSLLFIHLPIP